MTRDLDLLTNDQIVEEIRRDFSPPQKYRENALRQLAADRLKIATDQLSVALRSLKAMKCKCQPFIHNGLGVMPSVTCQRCQALGEIKLIQIEAIE